MDLKINREKLSAREIIYEGVQEQSVELDYILPDYLPDIFKLIKCSIVPVVSSVNVGDEIISYDLIAKIKILYCTENDKNLQCIDQNMTFSKSLPLEKRGVKPQVFLTPVSEHINFRVVNQRRIDMRGAVSVKIKIKSECCHEIISDAFGMNCQIKKEPMEYIAKKLTETKIISVNDDIEVGESKPKVSKILGTEVFLSEPDKKIISNKMVIKGNADVNVLYSGSDSIEKIVFSIPYSQIIDMNGLDESYICFSSAELISCDVTGSSGNEESSTIKCEIKIKLLCNAIKKMEVKIVTDAYSTSYPCEYGISKISLEQTPVMLSEIVHHKVSIEEVSAEYIYNVWCNLKNINIQIKFEEKKIYVSAMICYCLLCKAKDGTTFVIEKEEPFEHFVECEKINEKCEANLKIIPIDSDCTLTSSGGASIKSDIKICGELICSVSKSVLTDMRIDDTVKIKRDGDYALKLYFGKENEEIWDIAKRYSTSVNAVMDENSLENETLQNNGMLLIPIV